MPYRWPKLFIPSIYERDIDWAIKGYSVAADRYTLQTPNKFIVDVDDKIYNVDSQQDIDLSVAANWDTIAPTDYTVAATRAGKDFYVYACQPTSGTTVTIVLSANSTVPSGYTAANSRKVAGFHCLCVAVGTIGGHTLTGFVAGDILPDSIWDLKHRPDCSPEGMIYDSKSRLWVDIYFASGTGVSTASVYGGTISDTRNWMDFVDDGGAVKKRMLKDDEFQLIATGSNEETNIAGGTDPGTTGGHLDTASRRMISNIGCEDCCGVLWQWLNEQSYRYDGGSHTHAFTGDALANHQHDLAVIGGDVGPANAVLDTDKLAKTDASNVVITGADDPAGGGVKGASAGTPTGTNAAVDPVPAWGYYDLPGSKGSEYRQGTYGDVKLLAGANWTCGAASGSRARDASYYRWSTYANVGCRFGCESE